MIDSRWNLPSPRYLRKHTNPFSASIKLQHVKITHTSFSFHPAFHLAVFLNPPHSPRSLLTEDQSVTEQKAWGWGGGSIRHCRLGMWPQRLDRAVYRESKHFQLTQGPVLGIHHSQKWMGGGLSQAKRTQRHVGAWKHEHQAEPSYVKPAFLGQAERDPAVHVRGLGSGSGPITAQPQWASWDTACN